MGVSVESRSAISCVALWSFRNARQYSVSAGCDVFGAEISSIKSSVITIGAFSGCCGGGGD